MSYTVIKHDGHLRTLEKCRKHLPAARVFYISLVFSNAHRVLSQCNTRLRLLYLLNNYILFRWEKRKVCLSIVYQKLNIVAMFFYYYLPGYNFFSLLMGGSCDGCYRNNPLLARNWSVCPAWCCNFPTSWPASRIDWEVLC